MSLITVSRYEELMSTLRHSQGTGSGSTAWAPLTSVRGRSAAAARTVLFHRSRLPPGAVQAGGCSPG